MTLREQLQIINSVSKIEDIKLAYQSLYEFLGELSNSDNITLKLVNYQTSMYIAHVLHRKYLKLINEHYETGTNLVNSMIADMFKQYVEAYAIDHIVQSRQTDTYHIEISFVKKQSMAKTPFMSVSISCNSAGDIYDISLVVNDFQAAASVNDVNNWYDLLDKFNLQRQVMMQCQLQDDFKQIAVTAIANRTMLQDCQKDAETQFASLVEGFSVNMYEAIQYIAKPEVDFQLFSILPRQDQQPGFELYRYRVSVEKIHNVNVDTSLALLDCDGEVEVPEEFVRYESIRKRELPSFMQSHYAFITLDEYNARLNDENMFNWFD